jgi:hypothetical protein
VNLPAGLCVQGICAEPHTRHALLCYNAKGMIPDRSHHDEAIPDAATPLESGISDLWQQFGHDAPLSERQKAFMDDLQHRVAQLFPEYAVAIRESLVTMQDRSFTESTEFVGELATSLGRILFQHYSPEEVRELLIGRRDPSSVQAR